MSKQESRPLRRGFGNVTQYKTNRFNSQQFAEPLISQGDINVAVQGDPYDVTDRKNNIKRIDKAELMGTDLGDQGEFANIVMDEPLFIRRRHIVSTGRENLFGKNPVVRSSFNGLHIQGSRGRHATQSDWENQWDFFGFSHGAVTHTPGIESGMQISTRMAGSHTTYHTGWQEIHVGDDVEWCLNSINEEDRKEEVRVAPEVKYKSREKLGVIWRPTDYAESVYYLHDAFTITFDDQYASQAIDFTSLFDPYRGQNLDPKFRLGMQMRALIMFASWNGIVQAIERGWVKAQTPADFRHSTFDTDYDEPSYTTIEQMDPIHLARGEVTYDPDHRTLSFAEEADDLAKIETSRVNQWLAAKHGFFGDAYGRGTVIGSKSFINTVCIRSLKGMFCGPQEMEDMGDLSHCFPGELDDAYGANRSIPLKSGPNLATLQGHLLEMQGRAGNDLWSTMVQAYAQHKRKVVLKSLSHCGGGEKLDYIEKYC